MPIYGANNRLPSIYATTWFGLEYVQAETPPLSYEGLSPKKDSIHRRLDQLKSAARPSHVVGCSDNGLSFDGPSVVS